jgi:hypothetical protein
VGGFWRGVSHLRRSGPFGFFFPDLTVRANLCRPCGAGLVAAFCSTEALRAGCAGGVGGFGKAVAEPPHSKSSGRWRAGLEGVALRFSASGSVALVVRGACRTSGARGVFGIGTQPLRVGLDCAAPTGAGWVAGQASWRRFALGALVALRFSAELESQPFRAGLDCAAPTGAGWVAGQVSCRRFARAGSERAAEAFCGLDCGGEGASRWAFCGLGYSGKAVAEPPHSKSSRRERRVLRAVGSELGGAGPRVVFWLDLFWRAYRNPF